MPIDMRCVWVTIAIMMMGMASAETVVLDNHSISFELARPHQVRHVVENVAPSIQIKTFDGFITILFAKNGFNIDNPPRQTWYVTDMDRIGYISASGERGCLYKEVSGGTLSAIFPTFVVASNMNITDTINFLETLQIEDVRTPAALAPTP